MKIADKVADVDGRNGATIRNVLGDAVELIDHIEAAYEHLFQALNKPGMTLAHDSAKILVTLAGPKHLERGMMSLLRAYFCPMAWETRTALEGAGTAYAIQHRPELLDVFLKEEDPVKSGRAINTRVMFPTDPPEMHIIGKFYRKASILSHANRHTMIAGMTPDEGGLTSFGQQEIHKPEEVIEPFLWLCRAHIRILNATDAIFDSKLFDLGEFMRRGHYAYRCVKTWTQQHYARKVSEG